MSADNTIKPKYWDLPDDGAKFKCDECGEYGNYNEMYLTELNGDIKTRQTLHKNCIDPLWLQLYAEYQGKYPE